MKFSQITTRSNPSGADNFVGVGADNVDFKSPISALMPSGAVIPFAGASAPAGWLICQGQAVSRTTYAGLFSAISSAFGAGDGSTTFNVPDMRGRAPLGAGTGTFVEAIAAASVTVATDQLTISSAGGIQLLNGNAVVFTTTGTVPSPLVASTTYYVIAVDSTHIKLATSRANAVAGTAIDITTQGTGTHSFTLNLTARTLGDRGGEEAHATTVNETAVHAHATEIVTGSGSVITGFGHVQDQNVNALARIATQPTGGSAAANIMQPYTSLNYIIKT